MKPHITVDIYRYEATHGHKPRNTSGGWAFALDTARGKEGEATPVFICGTYKHALAQAKSQATRSVTVLP